MSDDISDQDEPRKPLSYYLSLEYTFEVIADPDGGYVIRFPDLPGCISQTDDLKDVPWIVDEIRELWIEGEYEDGRSIPLPTYPEEYSGKFNLRIPKSLHRKLAESAAADGVSLNQYVTMLLSGRDTEARGERKRDSNRSRQGESGRQVAEDQAPYGVLPPP